VSINRSNWTGDRTVDVVPPGVRLAAAWAWRLLVVGAAVYVVTLVIGRLAEVIVPLAIALLITALFKPLVDFLERRHVPRALAAVSAMLLGLGILTALIWIVVIQIQDNTDELSSGVSSGIGKVRDWLVDTVGLSPAQLDTAAGSAQDFIKNNSDKLTQGAISTATTLGHVVTGLLVVLFSTFFFLKDGRIIWLWVVRVVFPRNAEAIADEAGVRAWGTLGGYVRATVLVALIDAIGIGTACAILQVPLAFPIGVLVFLFSFVPLFGATVSGLVAVLIALVFQGPVTAVLVLAAVLLIQQLEGHVLQPVLMSRAVSVHPLAVVVGITSGVVVAGVIGALIAVPLIAMANTVGSFVYNHDPGAEAKLEKQVEGNEPLTADKEKVDAQAPNTVSDESDPQHRKGV
jgi:predicted PurR-regulated permease PerM